MRRGGSDGGGRVKGVDSGGAGGGLWKVGDVSGLAERAVCTTYAQPMHNAYASFVRRRAAVTLLRGGSGGGTGEGAVNVAPDQPGREDDGRRSACQPPTARLAAARDHAPAGGGAGAGRGVAERDLGGGDRLRAHSGLALHRRGYRGRSGSGARPGRRRGWRRRSSCSSPARQPARRAGGGRGRARVAARARSSTRRRTGSRTRRSSRPSAWRRAGRGSGSGRRWRRGLRLRPPGRRRARAAAELHRPDGEAAPDGRGDARLRPGVRRGGGRAAAPGLPGILLWAVLLGSLVTIARRLRYIAARASRRDASRRSLIGAMRVPGRGARPLARHPPTRAPAHLLRQPLEPPRRAGALGGAAAGAAEAHPAGRGGGLLGRGTAPAASRAVDARGGADPARRRRRGAGAACRGAARRRSLIVFPEGTRGAELMPAPFRSGLYHLARDFPRGGAGPGLSRQPPPGLAEGHARAGAGQHGGALRGAASRSRRARRGRLPRPRPPGGRALGRQAHPEAADA